MRYSTNLKRHSVDRHLLLHKLMRIRVNGEIFFIVKVIYRKTTNRGLPVAGLTDGFESCIEIRQKYSIRPLLSSLFIEDLQVD
jgi:hypothetical protein